MKLQRPRCETGPAGSHPQQAGRRTRGRLASIATWVELRKLKQEKQIPSSASTPAQIDR